MKRFVLLVLISALPYQLSVRAQEVNAHYDVETGLAHDADISPATTDESALTNTRRAS